MQSFGTGKSCRRTGTVVDVVAPARAGDAVKVIPVSETMVAPVGSTTMKVVELPDRLMPAPGDESKMVGTARPSPEYPTLCSVIELRGYPVGPFGGAASP